MYFLLSVHVEDCTPTVSDLLMHVSVLVPNNAILKNGSTTTYVTQTLTSLLNLPPRKGRSRSTGGLLGECLPARLADKDEYFLEICLSRGSEVEGCGCSLLDRVYSGRCYFWSFRVGIGGYPFQFVNGRVFERLYHFVSTKKRLLGSRNILSIIIISWII